MLPFILCCPPWLAQKRGWELEGCVHTLHDWPLPNLHAGTFLATALWVLDLESLLCILSAGEGSCRSALRRNNSLAGVGRLSALSLARAAAITRVAQRNAKPSRAWGLLTLTHCAFISLQGEAEELGAAALHFLPPNW